MFGTSGIRGPVGEVVTGDLALSVGRALATTGAERVVIGRDPRDSGRFLADALSAGLRECGSDVINIGLAATPTVARSVKWKNADAGVSITASHNPSTDNGIKLWNPSGQAFDAEQRSEITRRIEEEDFDLSAWDETGEEKRWNGANDQHVKTLAETVDVDSLSVVVDVGNGAGGVTADALYELGCDVETLNAQPDGRFPARPSEPTAENCQSLCDHVDATDADLGIAHDGDADRMMAVNENGEFVSGDVLLTLFARQRAGEGETIATPVDTSLIVEDVLAEQGGDVVRTQVGDVYVAERATESGVVFGGEQSGAWIWPDQTLCPDGPLAACRLAELIAKEGPLSELAAGVGEYPIRRKNIEVEDKEELMAALSTSVTDRYDDTTTIDGVRVSLPEGWFLIRASGTEPLIRIAAEARDPDAADEVFTMADTFVTDHLN
ncbi:phosphoglucosamine mutase [Haladaptatus caseinilyticus]|uniref:phosphoglucosamine mutase n=1 Tax=Haladaptatus caseinilyticus TaxID=2993314 RepID=UPI00224AB96D|nr:phosphoglucosamine mutase [Haladaptatus caseinilyticus]